MSRPLTLVRSGGGVYAVPGERVRAVRERRASEHPRPLVPDAPRLEAARVLELDTPDGSLGFEIDLAVEMAAIDDALVMPLPELVTRTTPLFEALAAFPDRAPVLVVDVTRLRAEDR